MEEVHFVLTFVMPVSNLALLPKHGQNLRVPSSRKAEPILAADCGLLPPAFPVHPPLEAWVEHLVLSGEQM